MLTNKQLLERKKGVGGSECAAVLGCSNFHENTPVKVYMDKITEEIIEPDFSEDQKERMRWGNLLEPIVRSEHEIRLHREIKTFDQAFVHPTHSWLRGNIDGWILDEKGQLSNELLEVKTCGYFDEKWGKSETDEMPDQYLLQCAYYCIACSHIKQIDRVQLVALAGGSKETRIYYYERDKEFEEFVISQTNDFWYNNVIARMPPEVQILKDLSILYPSGDLKKTCVATEDQYLTAKRLRTLKNAQKILKGKTDTLEMALKKTMQDNSYLVSPEEESIASWKNQITKRFQTKVLKEERPEIYNQFLVEKDSRVFRLSSKL